MTEKLNSTGAARDVEADDEAVGGSTTPAPAWPRDMAEGIQKSDTILAALVSWLQQNDIVPTVNECCAS